MTDAQPRFHLIEGGASPDRGDRAGQDAAVWASLDGALEDLLRVAATNPTASYAQSCALVDDAFDRRMSPHRHLAWAWTEAQVLRRQIKAGLDRQWRDADARNTRPPDIEV